MSLEATALLTNVAVFCFTLLAAIAVMVAAYYPSPRLNRAAGYLGFFAAITSGFSIYFSDRAFDAFKTKSEVEIATANKGAAEAKDRAAILENDNLGLRKELALLQDKTAKAVKRQEPRTFDYDSFLSILATAPPGKIKIGYIQGVPEPASLANNLRLALLRAKWNVLEFKPVVSVIEVGYSGETEVFLMVPDMDNMNPSQQALWKALEKAGFQWATIRDEKVPADTSVLLIGPKH